MTILELAHQTGLNPKWVSGTAGGEYHSACPICGGKDRFYIQPTRQMAKCLGSYCCRQCGTKGDSIQFARQFLNYSFQEAVEIVGATLIQNSHVPRLTHNESVKPAQLRRPPEQWIVKATKFALQSYERLLRGKRDTKVFA